MAASLKRTEYYYSAENALQNVAVWEFPEDRHQQLATATADSQQEERTRYWLIFIHGGAWRDPRQLFHDAEPTINALLEQEQQSPNASLHSSSASTANRIAGFASLNYRLSPHEQYAQDAASTPSFATRTARHPDHLVDVLLGLRFLQGKFGFGEKYVLFGHSAGAFLGYQVLIKEACLGLLSEGEGEGARDKFEDVVLPTAVVGFEGIYDLAGLNRRMNGGYAGFMEAAFGKDANGSWDAASPATANGSSFGVWGAQKETEKKQRFAVLAHSPEDELVDMDECDVMEARLRKDGVENIKVYRDLKGGHMKVVLDGSFARVLRETLNEVDRKVM
ncbi:hypothetical protein BD289DRAFT_439466 [Coniella lustricola]|uniref:Kynurenine formamidase n=1 Tax=Coniella lustricola TaxID=2025994 RepID=A0A2T3A1P0_9PEZI|nr:hypothetical protein BD289DRAFT_439466 [Coniella lustricola]